MQKRIQNPAQHASMMEPISESEPFKIQPRKAVKHTQTIRRQQLANCLSVFGHFKGLIIFVKKLHHRRF